MATKVERLKQKAEIDWSKNKPWGELGVDLPANASVDKILAAAELDWTVDRTPIRTAKKEIDGFAALVRSDTTECLDICGSAYKPVQNKDAFTFFKRFVEAGEAKLTEAGELKGGRLVWASADLNCSFTIGKKDTVKCKLLLASPHEQGKSFKLRVVAYRMVCGNGLMGNVTEAQFYMSHRLSFDDTQMTKAEKVLNLAHIDFERMADAIKTLSKKKVNRPQAITYLAAVFDPTLVNAPPDEILEKANKPIRLALEALDNAPGHDLLGTAGTAWGLLNAVTYTTDHLLGNTADARIAKAWFGRTAQVKQRAFTLATEI